MIKYELRIRWAYRWLQDRISKIAADNCQQFYKNAFVLIEAENDEEAIEVAKSLETEMIERGFILRNFTMCRDDIDFTFVYKSDRAITFPNADQPLPHMISFCPDDIKESRTRI